MLELFPTSARVARSTSSMTTSMSTSNKKRGYQAAATVGLKWHGTQRLPWHQKAAAGALPA